MNLLQQLQLATQSFLTRAYPEGVPTKIRDVVNDLQNIRDDQELLNWTGLEIEKNRYNLRLGNHRYPHMKLVFILENRNPVFYVDAHDAHFTLPPEMPGYDQLVKLRDANRKMKGVIEAAWSAEQLPIFGHQTVTVKFKKICDEMRVLAIDDEVQILEMLGVIITSLGATFYRAQSAEAARKVILEKEVPDLVFCDIMMPGESGYDFVDWFKDIHPNIPVYFITGLAQEDIEKIKIADVLQKPFSAKEVMTIMKKMRKPPGGTPKGK